MILRRGTVLVALATLALNAAVGEAQTTLDDRARREVVESLLTLLSGQYVFPETAAAMDAAVRARFGDGAYDDVTDSDAFADRLTADLQAVSHDRHLRVRARVVPAAASAAGRPDAARAFGRVEVLEGNIGYVEVLSFGYAANTVRTLVRDAMTKIAEADALIVDLRANGGGDPGFVALVSSYLFDDQPVHLNSLYFRPANRTTDFFTDPAVEGRKFGGTKPVYVLTSSRTFSAAEEFTYNLQSLGRAVIVGETTGGGAHPGGVSPLPYGMSVFVPSGRAINPITGTNWEGTGVVPEIDVPADRAFDEAVARARRNSAEV
jgi:hypothetical protein